MEKKSLNSTFVDASFIIALVNESDQYHDLANDLVEIYDKQPLITTETVLIEIGNALAGRFRPQAIQILDEFSASDRVEIVPLETSLFNKGIALYRDHTDKRWGLADCISFIVMREHGITDALTHDRHFQQAGFRALMREPVN